MFRLLLVAIACASCAALQPSALVSTRTAQRPAASALTMKHPDYFVRVARTEAGRPRLSVYRSNNNIYAQVIDDSKGHVLASASSKMKDTEINGANVAGAVEVGKLVAEKCKAIGITKVHFDRNGRVYHGRVKAVAEGAREGGLDF